MHALVAYASLGMITWVRLPVEGGRMAAVMFLDKRIQNGGFWDSEPKLCVSNTHTPLLIYVIYFCIHLRRPVGSYC